MLPIEAIKKEHEILAVKISEIEESFLAPDRAKIKILLDDFEKFWDGHERREEDFLSWFEKHSDKKFPYHMAIIDEHRQLRGHWKVLKDFLDNKDDVHLKAALDTDGRMVLDKIRKHMAGEDKYFDENFDDLPLLKY